MKKNGFMIIGQAGVTHGAESASSCSSKAPNLLEGSPDLVSGSEFRGCAAVVTLGCAKNHVDSEVILGVLSKFGFEVVKDLALAEVIVVNTCGFLESAVRESIDTVLEVSELRRTGRLRKLIVAGCAVSRYGPELEKELPEVDSFLSTDEIMDVGKAAAGEFARVLGDSARPYFLYDEQSPRVLATPGHFAYVKVAEGCNRPCAFCIIPKIRGSFRSRTAESVCSEISDLVNAGVREINLVAQDMTAWGSDQSSQKLSNLLRAISARFDKLAMPPWIRLLYAYPIGTDQELLSAITESRSICKYFDIPLQHASERVLKAMRRPVGRYSARSITEFIRKAAPEIAIRTTFITGFPGEQEQDVRELEEFISAGHFENVGVFTYSPELGTPAAEMSEQVPEELKEERRERLMLAQQGVVERRLKTRVGQTIEVLIDGAHADSELLTVGRTRLQAPEVDGMVILNDVSEDLHGRYGEQLGEILAPGAIVRAIITEGAEYDMVARVENILLAPQESLGTAGSGGVHANSSAGLRE